MHATAADLELTSCTLNGNKASVVSASVVQEGTIEREGGVHVDICLCARAHRGLCVLFWEMDDIWHSECSLYDKIRRLYCMAGWRSTVPLQRKQRKSDWLHPHRQ